MEGRTVDTESFQSKFFGICTNFMLSRFGCPDHHLIHNGIWIRILFICFFQLEGNLGKKDFSNLLIIRVLIPHISIENISLSILKKVFHPLTRQSSHNPNIIDSRDGKEN
jgi:hypothetical protein